MPYLIKDNKKLYYEVYGEGEAIIFSHGASWDHLQWKNQIDFLQSHFKVIVWDIRGHGKSNLPSNKVEEYDFVQDLNDIMNELNIASAHICGLSMGGHISLQFAFYYPEKVSSLILIGTPYTNKSTYTERTLVPINRYINKLLPIKLLALMQSISLSKYNKNNKEYIYNTVLNLKHENWVKIWQVVSKMESEDKLDSIVCPTLILCGEKDTLVMNQQTVLLEKIEKSTFKEVPNASHATNLDNPKRVNEYIMTFLNSLH